MTTPIPRYSPRDAARLIIAIEEIARRVVYRSWLDYGHENLDICLGCGCLVRLDEVCPGCRARQAKRKRAA